MRALEYDTVLIVPPVSHLKTVGLQRGRACRREGEDKLDSLCHIADAPPPLESRSAVVLCGSFAGGLAALGDVRGLGP